MRKRIIFLIVILAAWIRTRLMSNKLAGRSLLVERLAGFRSLMGKWKAWYCFEQARRTCPAYKDFNARNPGEPVLHGWSWVPDFTGVVPMDKPNFIKPYTLAQRCHGGKLPTLGSVIDESSGSTGKPNNWVRGPEERKAVAKVMQLALRVQVGDQQLFFINAFALGPWATGMSVSSAIVDECLLKSTGPDLDKIITTLQDFGPNFLYIIAGYPPFLKQLVDSKAVDWSKFNVIAFYGGEGMPEEMRTYLMRAFKAVYGDYGASDLEINIAAENDLVVAIRQLMNTNPKLRRRFNQAVAKIEGCERLTDALPHVFQYNPLDYLVETNPLGELLVTLCRASNVAPKIRYNIHDNGHVMTWDEAARILAEEGYDIRDLPVGISNLPLMFLYGRSDLSVEYYGCKITPSEIDRIVYENAVLSPNFSSFRLFTSADAELNKLLTLAIELSPNGAVADPEALRQQLFQRLADLNQDFREADRIARQKNIVPLLELHPYRTGPFEKTDIRLKANYIGQR